MDAMTTDKTMVFTEQAITTLNNMQQRINEIAYWHGEDEAGRAARSFARCINGYINMGGRVMSDGELSLVASTDVGLVVGFNWSRESLETTCRRLYKDEAEYARQVSLMKDIKGVVESGTWSLNS